MPDARNALFTIGHSTHEWRAFLRLLVENDVTAVADVRSQPMSRLPQFNSAELARALKTAGIDYVLMGRELGARRSETECYEGGQAIYEKIAQLPAFRLGLERLLEGLERHRIALMCAEKEPLDCHRTILVCRHLRDRAVTIRHILADGQTEDHATTEKRLVELVDEARNLFDQDLTDEEILNRAYEKRGRQIAFTVNPEGVLA